MDNGIKYLVVCDYREKFENYFKNSSKVCNDHFKKTNIDNIISTISELGYDCEYFGGVAELIRANDNHEKFENCVFLNFNDGLTQQHKRGQSPILLELLTNKFSGSDAFTSLLVSDKYCTNQFIKTSGTILTPRSMLYINGYELNEDNFNLSFPVIVKPNNEGSSIGIKSENYCKSFEDLKAVCKLLSKTYDKLILEEYIEGFEFTVFIVGNKEVVINQPLAIGKDDKYYFEYEIFDADSKFNHRRTYCAPQKLIPERSIETLKAIAKNAFDYLQMRDYARFDFRYKNGEFYFIEANSVPAIGTSSDVGAVCNILGIDFKQFISMLIETINKRLKIN